MEGSTSNSVYQANPIPNQLNPPNPILNQLNPPNPILNQLNPPNPSVANPNLNPSSALIQYGLSVGFHLINLESKRDQLLKTVAQLNQLVVQHSKEHPITIAHIHALEMVAHSSGQLLDVVTELVSIAEFSSFSLVSVLRENCLWVCEHRMIALVIKIYNMGWRGIIAIPSNIDEHEMGAIQNSLSLLQGLSSTVVDISYVQQYPPQQNLGL